MSIVALGEVMMRLSQPKDQSISNAEALKIYFGGGEYNTLVNLAGLNHQTKLITTLPDNQLGHRILLEARRYGVDTSQVKLAGERLGSYYAILGDEITPTTVIYDRKYSAFAMTEFNDYDFSSIFKGAKLFHVSGITAALNKNTKVMTLNAIKLAKSLGLKVSYDSNYRSKLWSQKEAGTFLKEVLNYVDYAFLGILDIKYLLEIEVEDINTGYQYLKAEYPNIEYFASTNRKVINPNEHTLSVNIFKDQLYTTATTTIKVKDRIGAGDVFTAGILDGILKQKELKAIAEFALADAVYKHYHFGDNTLVNRDIIMRVMAKENLKINR